MTPYYQDVYDHVLRATEWTESLRDLVATIVETNLTLQDNRLNLIMKKVTSWAAIIAVPTAVTGFYGQNLPYPGFATGVGCVFLHRPHRRPVPLLYVVFNAKRLALSYIAPESRGLHCGFLARSGNHLLRVTANPASPMLARPRRVGQGHRPGPQAEVGNAHTEIC